MSLSVDYLRNFVNDLILKNQAGGIDNEQFDRYWNGEQGAYMDDLLGHFQNRNNGKTGTNTGLIQNETILQKLSPFILPYTLTIEDGIVDKPEDFIYRVGMRVGNYDCYKINYNQRSSVSQSIIDPPSISANKYYFLEYEDYYEFLPSTLTEAILDYVKAPPPVKWGFVYDTDGRQIYNVGLSKQPLWDNNSCREICKRVLKTIGVAFKDSDFSNFGNSVIQTGD